MDTDLAAITAALDDTELPALIAATYGVPQAAPSLLAWIDHACNWKLQRRQGHDFTLRPSDAAIDPVRTRSASARQWRCGRRSRREIVQRPAPRMRYSMHRWRY